MSFERVLLFLLQVVWGLDQVKLLNPPEQPVPDHLLKILFSCDEPASVQLDCVVTFDTGVTSASTLKRWRCLPDEPKVLILELKLPDWLVYRPDWIVPASQEVLSCILLASIRRGGSEEAVAAQDVASLQLQPHFDRPVKEHRLCFSWSARMLQLTRRFSMKLCPLERGKGREGCAQYSLKPEVVLAELWKVSRINNNKNSLKSHLETVHLLSSIYASTGESFGITVTLEPYTSHYLEHMRVNAVSFPW